MAGPITVDASEVTPVSSGPITVDASQVSPAPKATKSPISVDPSEVTPATNAPSPYEHDQKIASAISDNVKSGLTWLQKSAPQVWEAAKSLIPETLDPARQVAQKMAAKGAEVGGNLAESIAANPGAPSSRVAPAPQPALVPKEQFEQTHPNVAGVAKGVGSTVGGLVADPTNWLIAGGMGTAGPVLQRVISGGFGATMGKSAIDAATDLKQNWDNYTPAQRAEKITEGGLSGIMAAAAGTHALTGGMPEVSKPTTEPTIDTTKTAGLGTEPAKAPITVDASQVSPVPEKGTTVPEASAPATTTGMETPSAIQTAQATAKALATDDTGTLDINKLHEIASTEMDKEIKPFLAEKKASYGAMFDEIRHFIAPRSGAERETLDSVFNLAGKQEQHKWTLDQALQPVRNSFDRTPQEAQVDFVDRSKAGEKQATPQLQSVDDFMRKTDDDTMRVLTDTQVRNLDPKTQQLWAKMSEAEKQSFVRKVMDFRQDETLTEGPLKELANNLTPYKENHFRVMWDTVPGKALPEDVEGPVAPGKSGSSGKGIRPLEGSKGFMRQSTLDSMSEGLARGGVPVSYNPVRMFEHAQADSWRYITAQRMWQDAEDQGARVFVKRGSPPPDGFHYIDDKIGNVSFPAKSGEGSIQAGKWAMRDDYARLLTNMLSDDKIRGSAIGSGIMDAKNMLTQYRLGLSPFHAFTTTVSAMASNLNRGVTGVYDAFRTGDPLLAGQGIKDVLRTPTSPIQDYKLGSDVVKYASNPAEFLKTMRGQDFVKTYPDADRLVDDLFSGGAKLGLHEDERVSQIAKMKQAFADDKPIAGILRGPLALNEKAFQPLFSYYIPRLKVATWLRDYSSALVDRADDLNAGKTTRGELARKTWDSVDNMYGQMNWDARYWNRNLKTAIQMGFRAFTWFAGNVRMVKDAGIGQTQELGRSLQYLSDRSAGRPTEPGSTALPRLDPNMGKIISLLALTAAGNTALQVATGNGMPKDAKDLMAARIGKNKDGSPMRVTLPAIVVKDGIAAIYGGVGNYLKAKESDLLSGILDAANNADYRGAMIHHPEDSWWKQRYDDLKHGVGNPIGVSTYLRARDQGGGTVNKVLGSVGFAPAPKEIDMSKGAIASRDFVRAYSNKNIPEASLIKGQKTTELRREYQGGTLPLQRLRELSADGEITEKQAKKVASDPEGNLVDDFKGVPLEKALDFWPDYSKEEQAKLAPVLRKRASTIGRLDRTPLQKQQLSARAKEALGMR